MNKKYIKQAFKHEEIQLGKGAIESIEYELKLQVSLMAKRCKEGNLKRLTPELFWVALGRMNNDWYIIDIIDYMFNIYSTLKDKIRSGWA